MYFLSSLPPLAASFFRPLAGLLPGLPHQRSCPGISDSEWILLCILRVLEDDTSGRGFLQKATSSPLPVPSTSSFFGTLASARRLRVVQAANQALASFMARTLPDPFEAFPQLQPFDLHAGDGHFHAAAVHDSADDKGIRQPTGHVYLMNLRTQAVSHLDPGDGIKRSKEHDINVVKRAGPEALRGDAPTGRRVIIVWDRAIIDFEWWQAARNSKGLYFVTRPKSNTALTRVGFNEYNPADPVNAGVISDELGAPASTSRIIRRITWTDPVSGAAWQYLTNEMTLPPGLVVLLYRRRWDIEKVFDTFKNKFHEKKSWASTPTAKCAQAAFLCLAHNLTVLKDHVLAEAEIVYVAEIERRKGRLERMKASVAAAGRIVPITVEGFQRLTQRSVKFIRWLQQNLWSESSLGESWAILKELYRKL